MLDVVRSVDGVRETSTMLSFGGRADIDTLLELEMEVSTNNMIAATVMIDVQPGLDRKCFQHLLDLPPPPGGPAASGCSTATTARIRT